MDSKSKGPIWRQTYAALCGNLMTASFGTMSAWSTINFVALQREDTTFPSGPLSLREATLTMSISMISGIIGNLLFPIIVRRFGSKTTLLGSGFPQIISWLLIIYAQNPYYLYSARILSGLATSGLTMALPMFIIDICHDRIRGTLVSLFDPFMNCGAVFAFVLGKYYNYADQAKFHLVLSIVYMILFARIPDSPQHLVKMQREKAANKAHKFFKGTELEKLPVDETVHTQENPKLTLSDFTNRRARKAMFIAFSCMALNAMQGFIILVTYVTEIFTSSNPNVSPIDASIVITTLLIIANLIFMNSIDRAGRRTFYIYSSLATTIVLGLFALYLYYLTDNHAFDWVPVVSLASALFVSCLGMNPVPFVSMVEVLPHKVKGMCMSWAFNLMTIILFVLIEIYPMVKEHIGLFGWITIFAVMSFCNALFAIFILPETRGKSHEEIMQMLDKK